MSQGIEDPFDKFLNITIVSATADGLASLSPEIYVLVACGGNIQTVDGVPLSLDAATWNKTLHFSCEAGQANDTTNLTLSLYQKDEGDDILLGQTIEDLSHIEKDTDITRQFVYLDCKPSVTFRVVKSRVYALIIGISEYFLEEARLNGCVNDAREMEDFLRNDLKVPSENVRVLLNQDATRKNILDSIHTHLLENTSINYGDPMIIFYAGHGSRVGAPLGWISSDQMVETICPYDETALDENGEPIPGIPDCTINTLVRRLAEAKGNNITLIFDSCHSGGISRGGDDYEDISCKVRSFPRPCPLNSAVDSAIWGETARGAHQVLPAGFQYEDMASHVLLAACKPIHGAMEIPIGNIHRGWFSSRLIPKLREMHRQSTPLSYLQLMNQISSFRVPLPMEMDQTPRFKVVQTPQCLGRSKNSLMFTLGGPTKPNRHFKLKSTNDGFEIGLGSMHGVVVGTEFLIVQGPKRERIGLLVATGVFLKRSILVPSSEHSKMNVPPDAEAIIWNWNNVSLTLKVFTDSDDVRGYISTTELHAGHNICLVNSKSDAHVSISHNRFTGKYEVERHPGFLSEHPDIKGESRGAASNLSEILTAVCHFRYHLQRAKMTTSDIQVGTSLSEDAAVEMHLLRLIMERIPNELPQFVPRFQSRDLFDDQCNATMSGTEAGQNYGIKITNKSDSKLFVYLFYFNPADYSIQEWCLPPSHTMDPPLQLAQSVTIGYGANGGDPFCFDLDQGQKEGTGFLKLFVSDSYVDMTYLVQVSPFSPQQQPRAQNKGTKNVVGSLVAKITVVS